MAGRKGTHKLNELLDIQKKMQKKWAEERAFELDAAQPGSDESKCVKQICTFTLRECVN